MINNTIKNKKLRGILQVAFSLILLTYLLIRVGPAQIVTTLVEINPVWFGVAFALFLLNVVLRAYRWHILLRSLDDRPSLPYLIYLYFVGYFFNNFIPTGFGGDVVKVISLRQNYGRGTEALSSVMMDRLTGLLGSSIIALLALIWNLLAPSMHIAVPPPLLWVAFFISMSIPTGFLFLRYTNPLAWLARVFPFTRPVTGNEKLLRLAATIRRYPLWTLVQSLLISLPFTLNLILVQFTVARALNVDVALPLFALFVPIIAIVNLLPISFNGLGTREGIYLLLFVPVGIPQNQAVAMSLAYYFLRVSTGLIGGILLAIRSLSQITRPAPVKTDT
jgi:uncharacterized membrane protein YbhN (UPF0104 family)